MRRALITRQIHDTQAMFIRSSVTKTRSYFLLSILPFFTAFSRIPILRSARILPAVGLHLFQSATAKRPEN